jgi:Glutathione S-transferase, N-terminal domain
MKLYVCYGTWTVGKPVHAHPCGEAHKALTKAGHRPEVVHSYGLGPLPGLINDLTPRREVKQLTGNYWVPVLVTDDGEVIQGSQRIVDWARANPAGGAGGGAAAGSRAA